LFSFTDAIKARNKRAVKGKKYVSLLYLNPDKHYGSLKILNQPLGNSKRYTATVTIQFCSKEGEVALLEK